MAGVFHVMNQRLPALRDRLRKGFAVWAQAAMDKDSGGPPRRRGRPGVPAGADVKDQIVSNIEAVAGKPLLTTHPVIDTLAGRLRPLAARVNAELSRNRTPWQPFAELASLDSRRSFVKAATHLLPQAAFDTTRLLAVQPPDDIHRMQRSDPYWIGDFFSANMIVHALRACRLDRPDQTVLDIGCSSGSLVRMLAAYEGSWSLHGCDPIASAIDWAQAHVPTGRFFHMNLKPPLDLDDASLDGVTAISVWSHHRPDAAELWMAEVARVLRPGGWFAVTFSSLHHVRWLARNPRVRAAELEAMLRSLAQSGNHFVPVRYKGEDADTDVDWGQSCYARERFFGMAYAWFDVAGYFSGLNQGNQDVAVLVRRGGGQP